MQPVLLTSYLFGFEFHHHETHSLADSVSHKGALAPKGKGRGGRETKRESQRIKQEKKHQEKQRKINLFIILEHIRRPHENKDNARVENGERYEAANGKD